MDVLVIGFVLIAAGWRGTQRRLDDESIRFLQHGVVVIAQVATVPKDPAPRSWQTQISYAYTAGLTRHVHTFVRPHLEHLWSPFEMIYDRRNPRSQGSCAACIRI